MRQAQRDPPGEGDAQFCRARDDAFHRVIGDRGDDRRDRAMGRHPGLRQRAQRREPFGGGGRARFDQTRQARVERGDRNRHRDQVFTGHLFENVEVGQHPVGLGGDGHRMAGIEAHFQHRAGDAVPAFDRLVGIGIGPHRDRARLVAGLGQRFGKQLRRVGLGEQLAFEIEAGRQIKVSVCGPGEAIDAAMLAPPVSVDRTVEADVGRLVEAEDRARMLDGHFRAQLGGGAVDVLALVPPVAIGFMRGEAEARGYVAALRSSAFDPFHGAEHRANMDKSRCGFFWSRYRSPLQSSALRLSRNSDQCLKWGGQRT